MTDIQSSNSPDIRNYFGFKAYPFAADIDPKSMYLFRSMVEINDGIAFAVQQSMYFAVIGDVGAGKTTALRYSLSQFPSKRYRIINAVGGEYSFIELLRHVMACLGVFTRTNQQTGMLRSIYDSLASVRSQGMVPVLCIDEAHLLKPDVFAQLHLLSQQTQDQSRFLPMVICGQDGLFDRLSAPYARPIMSRIINGYNMKGLSQDECIGYIRHHVSTVGGPKAEVFSDTAMIALTQASAGIPRRINSLCLKSMRIAISSGARTVTPEIVRQACKEWWK